MRIIIEVENRDDFDGQFFVDWLNETLDRGNRSGNGNTTYWARLVGTEGEDDEND